MAVYVLLAIEDDEDAKELVKQVIEMHGVFMHQATVRGVWKKPTIFCDPSDGHRKGRVVGYTRGKKYGWWVCSACGKPAKAWATGDVWYTALGTNLLPKELAPEYKPVGWESPAGWTAVELGVKEPETQEALL